jgi:hypothetical protein
VVTGVMQWFNKRKETRRIAVHSGAIMGALVILFPTALIGVCAPRRHLQPDYAPGVDLHGRAVLGINLVTLITNERRMEPVA